MLQWEHSAILSTFIKLPSVNKIFVLSIFAWPLMTGFIVGLDKQQFLRKIVIGDSNSNDKYVLSERAV